MISTIHVNMEQMVEDFMRKHNQYVGGRPSIPNKDTEELAITLIREESKEVREAMECADLVEIADGLGDLLVVTFWGALAYGMPINNIFNEIHTSNMTKSGSKRADGKVTKGLEYVPPDIKRILGI